MNVRKLIAPLGLSMAYLVSAARGGLAQDNALVQKPPENFPAIEMEITDGIPENDPMTWQAAKLQELIDLPDGSRKMIAGLKELKDFYEDNMIHKDESDYGLFSENRKKLVAAAKDQLERLFQRSLQFMCSENPQEQKIGAESISIFRTLFPTGCGYQIGEILNAKNNSASFFEELFEMPWDDDSAILNMKTGLGLLHLSLDGKSYPQMFVSWLNKTGTQVTSDVDSSKELQSAYEETIREMITHSYDYFPNMAHFERYELIISLLPAYINIVNKLGPSPKSFENILSVFDKLKEINHHELAGHPGLDLKLTRSMTSLFDFAVTGLAQTGNLRGTDTRPIFMVLQKLKIRNSEMLDSLAGSLSRNYFSGSHNDPESLIEFINAVNIVNQSSSIPVPLVYRIAFDNPKYFLENIRHLTALAEESQSIDAKTKALRMLGECFAFCHLLPRITDDQIKFPNAIYSRFKIGLTVTMPVEHLISSNLLTVLRNADIKVVDHNEELNPENRIWKAANESLSQVLPVTSGMREETYSCITSRIDDDACTREMDYETLGILLVNELQNSNGSEILYFLRSRLASEEPSIVLNGIATALAHAMVYEKQREVYEDKYDPIEIQYVRTYEGKYMPYRRFFRMLKDFSEGKTNRDDLVNISYLNLSPVQYFILNQVRILEWDLKLCRDILPRGAISVYIDEDEERFDFDIEGYKALQRLRANAFFVLASTANQVSDYLLVEKPRCGKEAFRVPFCAAENIAVPYKAAVTAILERGFERDYLYSGPDYWGIYASGLIGKYLNIDDDNLKLWQRKREAAEATGSGSMKKDESTETKSEKIPAEMYKGFVQDRLSYLRGILFDGDNPGFEHYTGPVDKLREQFALQVLSTAPYGNLKAYKKCLGIPGLGFGESKLNEVLVKSMHIEVVQH